MDFLKNEPLASHSNFNIGGPARFFFAAQSEGEIRDALLEANRLGAPVFILSGGTNVLFADEGFPGLVLKPELKFLKREGGRIFAGAGVLMRDLLNFAAENDLSGLEWAGGLPGTLGGAIRGNAGAFGGEIGDSVESVKSLDRNTLEILERDRKSCGFGYRSSVFRRGESVLMASKQYGVASMERGNTEIILEAVLFLGAGESEKIRSAAEEKIRYRKERQPLEYPNIGSIFKNVPVENFKAGLSEELRSHVKTDPFPLIPAATLISQAGLKGKRIGGAAISEKHANFIVNTGGARATDVLGLIDLAKDKVLEKFGVKLEPEVELAL
jgi:UDP-N-acetylmuramate dehydrogenase